MRYDDIIMGAGSSGAALAARLSEDPNRSVLLLEAGPDYRTIEETPHDLLHTSNSFADHDWGWSAQATSQREIPFYRGKVTGGCSAINAAVAIRGVPADYDEWAALGNQQWTFGKSPAGFSQARARRRLRRRVARQRGADLDGTFQTTELASDCCRFLRRLPRHGFSLLS